MKFTSILIFSTLSLTSGFTVVSPVTQQGRDGMTALSAKKASLPDNFKSGGGKPKKSFFSTVFDMDLWKDRADSNDYGGRSKKVEWSAKGLGKIQDGKSYVPSGMNAAQYNAMRAKERKAKEDNYARNVAKGGKFEDYTEFYKQRGTDLNGSWLKSVTRGHKMVKTKYDWGGDGSSNLADMKQFESNISKGKKKPMFGKKK